MDPCAGDGAAAAGLARAWGATEVYVAELETARARALRDVQYDPDVWGGAVLHVAEGDALTIPRPTASSAINVDVLYLNPPYDLDPVTGRLETRWLERFAAWVRPGGALLLVVPYPALASLAPALGRDWEGVTALALPEPHFSAFRQVVVLGRRRVSDPYAPAWVVPGLATLEVLGGPRAAAVDLVVGVRPRYGYYGAGAWVCAGLDVEGAAAEFAFGYGTGRGKGRAGALVPYEAVRPGEGVRALQARTYTLATRPKPGHVAAAIVCGVFDGERVVSADPRFPPIHIKGAFRRRYQETERRYDAEGSPTASIQVQTPSLAVSILLPRGTVLELRRDVDPSESADMSLWTVGDLLLHYGPDLLRLLRERCPLRFDPDAAFPVLDTLRRRLFPAQREIVVAAAQALGRRESFLIQGQTGTGKTTMAAATIAASGCRRVVVVAPPHLTAKTWPSELRAVFGDDVVVVPLTKPSDVRALAEAPLRDDPRIVVGVVSREAAKLGHAFAGLGARCPTCGAQALGTPDTQARRRQTCAAPVGDRRALLGTSRAALEFCRALAAAGVQDSTALAILRPWSPALAERAGAPEARGRLTAAEAEASAQGPRLAAVRAAASALAARLEAEVDRRGLFKAFDFYNLAVGLYRTGLAGPSRSSALVRFWARAVRALLRVAVGERHEAWVVAAGQIARDHVQIARLIRLEGLEDEAAAVLWGAVQAEALEDAAASRGPWARDRLDLDEDGPGGGDGGGLADVLTRLAQLPWPVQRCGAPLYTAIAAPRRVPLADVVCATAAAAQIDLLVVDEAHEYNSADSAQGQSMRAMARAAQRALFLTGTINNGYADALFEALRALSPDFRCSYGPRAHAEFQAAYGYTTRRVDLRGQGAEAAGRAAETVQERGAVSARVVRGGVTITGKAPGVLPAAILRWLLPHAGTLDLESVAATLPPKTFEVLEVAPDPTQRANADHLLRETMEAIRMSRRDPNLAGRLFGALARLPSYYDVCVRREDEGAPTRYEVRWPEEVGGGLVGGVDLHASDTVLPKVAEIAARIRRELAEGRRVLVLAWAVDLVEHLAADLRQAFGVLGAGPLPKIVALPRTVQARKREAWLDAAMAAPGGLTGAGPDVLIAQPRAVETGLNNLVRFCTQIWVQNPAVNAYCFRQVIGRAHRIGQTEPVRIVFYDYGPGDASDGSPALRLQPLARRLLLHKVGVSEAVDGLDASAALRAAGVEGSDDADTMGVGKALYRLLCGD